MITCILVKGYLKVSALYFYSVLICSLFWSSNIEGNMEARIAKYEVQIHLMENDKC